MCCRMYPIKVTKHAVEAKISGRFLRNQMILGTEYMGCVTNPVIWNKRLRPIACSHQSASPVARVSWLRIAGARGLPFESTATKVSACELRQSACTGSSVFLVAARLEAQTASQSLSGSISANEGRGNSGV